ncbi:ESCRT-related protein CHMP1B [Cryptosporidium felis]|nr:ESCRT-related protein CHMP1B [Cryptosporidium felis]
MGNKISIDDSIFELKVQKKELERQYKKRDRDSKNERKKAKDALISGKADLSRIYAENSLRMQDECKELLIMSSKLDRLCSRLERASSREKISSQLLEIVPKLRRQLSEEGVMGYSNISKIKEIGQILNNIEESQPERAGESAGSECCMHENKSVDKLLEELLDEHAMEIDLAIPSISRVVEPLDQDSGGKTTN